MLAAVRHKEGGEDERPSEEVAAPHHFWAKETLGLFFANITAHASIALPRAARQSSVAQRNFSDGILVLASL